MLSNSGRSTTMGSIGQELQDLGHRVTAIRIFDCLNDCDLLCMDKFGERVVFNDGNECHHDRCLYERHLNIQSTLQHHLTLLQIVKNISLIENVCVVEFGSHIVDDYNKISSKILLSVRCRDKLFSYSF